MGHVTKPARLLPRVFNSKLAPTIKLSTTDATRFNIVTQLTTALFKNKVIKTTLAKAKLTRFYAQECLNSPEASTLFKQDPAVIEALKGKSVRVLECARRDYKKQTQGPMQYVDGARMAFLEIVGDEESVSAKLFDGKYKALKGHVEALRAAVYDEVTGEERGGNVVKHRKDKGRYLRAVRALDRMKEEGKLYGKVFEEEAIDSTKNLKVTEENEQPEEQKQSTGLFSRLFGSK